MKKVLILSLLFVSAQAQANQFAMAYQSGLCLLKDHPEVVIGSIGFLANLRKQYIRPNLKAGILSAGIYGAHRLAGGSVSPMYAVAAYGVCGAVGKAVSRPFYDFWGWIKKSAKKAWNEW